MRAHTRTHAHTRARAHAHTHTLTHNHPYQTYTDVHNPSSINVITEKEDIMQL